MFSSYKILYGCVMAVIFFGLGFVVRSVPIVNQTLSSSCKPTHTYVNSILDCLNTDSAYGRIDDANKQVSDYIASQIDSGKATRVSVFYRDLTTNRWYGINQTDTFSPGSLLKLPLAMAYTKYAELNPAIMQQQFVFKQVGASGNDLEHYKPKNPIVNGTSYTVRSLINHAIEDSDNDATNILFSHIDGNFYQNVLQDLGVTVPISQQGGLRSDFYSASSYAGILRQLYNSSYLSIDDSDRLLASMASSTFTAGIVAGVPEGTVVAHKFGEGTAVDPATGTILKEELHDCGIVYDGDSHHIICVMTEGHSFDDLSAIIAHISKIVWDSDTK